MKLFPSTWRFELLVFRKERSLLVLYSRPIASKCLEMDVLALSPPEVALCILSHLSPPELARSERVSHSKHSSSFHAYSFKPLPLIYLSFPLLSLEFYSSRGLEKDVNRQWLVTLIPRESSSSLGRSKNGNQTPIDSPNSLTRSLLERSLS